MQVIKRKDVLVIIKKVRSGIERTFLLLQAMTVYYPATRVLQWESFFLLELSAWHGVQQ